MSSRNSSQSDDSTTEEELLGGVSVEEARKLLPTAEEFGRGLLTDE